MPSRSASREEKSAGRGAESFGLFQQHAMTGKRFAEGAPERHGIALGASLFAQVVVCGQNLSPAVGEGGDCLAMTPAESGAPDFSGDANQRVVVRGGFQAFVGPGCWLPASQPPPAGPAIRRRRCSRAPLPWAGSATSALPDCARMSESHDRPLRLVLLPPFRDGEGQRCAVDIDIEPLTMPGRGRVDRLPRGPVVGQQVGPGPRSAPAPDVMVSA